MKRLIVFILLSITAACNKPLIVQIDDLPDNTPLHEAIYITGNFNHWNPSDPSYQINRNSEGGGYVELPRGIGELEYKFTRGDWNSEEVDSCGNVIVNRLISNFEYDEQRVRISQWKDLPEHFCDGIELTIEVPTETPFPTEIYVGGEFNMWEAGQVQYKAEYAGNDEYRIVLPKRVAGSKYKITRGTWNTVEVGKNGRDIDDRILSDSPHQIADVSLWKDMCLQEHPYRYIVLQEVPKNTPHGSNLYFASNINGWDPNNRDYRFAKMLNGEYIIRIPNTPDPIEFKITRGGGWHTVETGENDLEISNRTLSFDIQDTIRLRVYNWKDI